MGKRGSARYKRSMLYGLQICFLCTIRAMGEIQHHPFTNILSVQALLLAPSPPLCALLTPPLEPIMGGTGRGGESTIVQAEVLAEGSHLRGSLVESCPLFLCSSLNPHTHCQGEPGRIKYRTQSKIYLKIREPNWKKTIRPSFITWWIPTRVQ